MSGFAGNPVHGGHTRELVCGPRSSCLLQTSLMRKSWCFLVHREILGSILRVLSQEQEEACDSTDTAFVTGHTAALNSIQISLLSAPGEAAHWVPNTTHFPLPPKHLHTRRWVPNHRICPQAAVPGSSVHVQWSSDSVHVPSVRLSVLFFSNQIFKAHRVSLMLRTFVWISLCQFIFYFQPFIHYAFVKLRVGLFPVTRKWQGRSVCSGSHITLFPVVPPDIFAGENPSVSLPDDCSYCGACYELTISVIVIAHLWEQRQGAKFCSAS